MKPKPPTSLPPRPLHVLLVSPTEAGPFLGGADRDWVNLLNALGPENIRVTWVGNTGTDSLRNCLDSGVLARTIDLPHPCFHGLNRDTTATNLSIWLWGKIGAATSVALVRASLRLRRALHGDPVDIVVTNTALPRLGALYAKLIRRPHVWSIKEHVDPQQRARRAYVSMITRLSTAVVVPSRAIGEAFGSRAHVLPDGVDVVDITSRAMTSRTDVLRSLDLPTDLPMVVQVGAISARKGQHVTAEAFVRLASRGGPPTCSLVFLGCGSAEQNDRVQRVLADAGEEWGALVRFDSFENGDLSSVAAADIVVHPATFHDAWPNAVREAMTLGKPVVASAMGGLVDILVDGESGVLIAADDAAALASALEALVADPAERRRLGAGAAEFARRHFDIHDRKRAFLELFDAVVSR